VPTLLELQDTLYDSSNPTRRWLHRSRQAWIEAELRRRAGPGVARALEVGPGSGVYLPVLAGLAGEVVATDIEPGFLERARVEMAGFPHLSFVVDDICATRLPSGSFDLVLCTEVIEHIADSQAALRSIGRLLRPGGILVLSTPQPWSTLEVAGRVAFRPGVIRVVRRIYHEPILETGHINLLSPRRLDDQLRAAGLTIESRHTAGVYLPVLAELGGERARRLASWLEPRLRASPLQPLLWTQHVVARS
jgi:SAM-dependent methyltransferase